eukprot:8948032-Karenia_brevis.AAC.1
MGFRDWITAYKCRKWRFVGKLAVGTNMKWSKRLLRWVPFFRCAPWRHVGRPVARWEDKIMQVAGDNWNKAAEDSALWRFLEPRFIGIQ